MIEKEQYENVDLPFYREKILPVLPVKVLDFHTHSWKKEQWISSRNANIREKSMDRSASIAILKSEKYMITEREYSLEQLLLNVNRIFPNNEYNVVVFGQPTPTGDLELTNRYIAQSGIKKGLYPLIIAGKGLYSKEELKQRIIESGFFGYKVYLNWIGNDYGNVNIEDMLGSDEMELANELNLIVMIHVPRSGRLADPEIQNGVRKYSRIYPNANIILAHCGRCYHPDEMKRSINSIKDLDNVYMDTSMVMDPLVLKMVFDNIDSSRVLYATDFPVAAMRGRRVNVMDHWVDVVLEGYPKSEYRVASDNIRATFMAYEIILAIKYSAEAVGLTDRKTREIFHDNGMKLLNKVKNTNINIVEELVL